MGRAYLVTCLVSCVFVIVWLYRMDDSFFLFLSSYSVSHTPVHQVRGGPWEELVIVPVITIAQDGSCNGLQHYAALGRDAYGAKQVWSGLAFKSCGK